MREGGEGGGGGGGRGEVTDPFPNSDVTTSVRPSNLGMGGSRVTQHMGPIFSTNVNQLISITLIKF